MPSILKFTKNFKGINISVITKKTKKTKKSTVTLPSSASFLTSMDAEASAVLAFLAAAFPVAPPAFYNSK